MFSGIVEEMGFIQQLHPVDSGLDLTVSCKHCLEDVHLGDSISVNGVCLTVTGLESSSFRVHAVPETLQRTNLSFCQVGTVVNLERSLRADARIGGHFVGGHVDAPTEVSRREPHKIWFKKPSSYEYGFVPKGYIAVDGMSLTLVDIQPEEFSICFIPHTLNTTIARTYKPGTVVNLELDTLVKTVYQTLLHLRGVNGQD